MNKKIMNRRNFLRLAAMTGAGAAIAACATPTPQVVKETVVVEKEKVIPQTVVVEKEKVVQQTVVVEKEKQVEKVVTATPAPAVAPATVNFFAGDVAENKDAFLLTADAFNARSDKVKVKINLIASQGFGAKIQTMIAANDGPDLWPGVSPGEAPRRGAHADITAFVQRDIAKPQEYWFQMGIDRSMYQGKWYAVPKDVGWNVIAYNIDMYEKFGVPLPKENWTFDDFIAMGKQLHRPDEGYFGTQFSGNSVLLWGGAGIPYNLGFKMQSDDGHTVKGFLDTPTSIEAIQWVIDLQDKHKISVSGEQAQALGGEPFYSGKVGLGVAGVWGLRDLLAAKFKFGLIHAPIKKAGDTIYTWGGAAHVFMWSGAKNKEANWEVMKFWSSPEGSKIAHVMRVAASPNPVVWTDHADDKDPVLGVFLKDGLRPTFQPPYEISSYFWQCVGGNFGDIWTRYLELKERPLENIAKDAAEKAQKCLDDNYSKEKK